MFQSEVSRSYMAVIGVCVLVISVFLFFTGSYPSFGESVRKALFQVTSLASTSGFATADTNLWPPVCIVILIGCSVVCGCSGSTSGGMKFDRLLVCYKSIKAHLNCLVNPSQVNMVKVDGRPISERRVSDSKTFMAIFMFLIAIGAIINTAFGMDLVSGFTASIASLSNVGPGFGTVGSISNYSQLPIILKFNCAFLMLLGRLEIFSLIYVLGFRNRK